MFVGAACGGCFETGWVEEEEFLRWEHGFDGEKVGLGEDLVCF